MDVSDGFWVFSLISAFISQVMHQMTIYMHYGYWTGLDLGSEYSFDYICEKYIINTLKEIKIKHNILS